NPTLYYSGDAALISGAPAQEYLFSFFRKITSLKNLQAGYFVVYDLHPDGSFSTEKVIYSIDKNGRLTKYPFSQKKIKSAQKHAKQKSVGFFDFIDDPQKQATLAEKVADYLKTERDETVKRYSLIDDLFLDSTGFRDEGYLQSWPYGSPSRLFVEERLDMFFRSYGRTNIHEHRTTTEESLILNTYLSTLRGLKYPVLGRQLEYVKEVYHRATSGYLDEQSFREKAIEDAYNVVPDLMESLEGEEPEIIYAKITSPEIYIQSLVDSLSHSDKEVRNNAVVMLGMLMETGDNYGIDVVDELLFLLEHESEISIKNQMIIALGRIGSSKAVSKIASYLANEQHRTSAALALGYIGDKDAIPLLLSTVHDPIDINDQKIIYAYAFALARMPYGSGTSAQEKEIQGILALFDKKFNYDLATLRQFDIHPDALMSYHPKLTMDQRRKLLFDHGIQGYDTIEYPNSFSGEDIVDDLLYKRAEVPLPVGKLPYGTSIIKDAVTTTPSGSVEIKLTDDELKVLGLKDKTTSQLELEFEKALDIDPVLEKRLTSEENCRAGSFLCTYTSASGVVEEDAEESVLTIVREGGYEEDATSKGRVTIHLPKTFFIRDPKVEFGLNDEETVVFRELETKLGSLLQSRYSGQNNGPFQYLIVLHGLTKQFNNPDGMYKILKANDFSDEEINLLFTELMSLPTFNENLRKQNSERLSTMPIKQLAGLVVYHFRLNNKSELYTMLTSSPFSREQFFTDHSVEPVSLYLEMKQPFISSITDFMMSSWYIPEGVREMTEFSPVSIVFARDDLRSTNTVSKLKMGGIYTISYLQDTTVYSLNDQSKVTATDRLREERVYYYGGQEFVTESGRKIPFSKIMHGQFVEKAPFFSRMFDTNNPKSVMSVFFGKVVLFLGMLITVIGLSLEIGSRFNTIFNVISDSVNNLSGYIVESIYPTVELKTETGLVIQFPSHFPNDVKGERLTDEEQSKALSLLQKVMAKYPRYFVEVHVDRIIVGKNIVLNGKPVGGFQNGREFYVSYDSLLDQSNIIYDVFDHELNHAVIREREASLYVQEDGSLVKDKWTHTNPDATESYLSSWPYGGYGGIFIDEQRH
ncbi:HEAT repeat domain-containing protein, partial [Candidatus Woesearchaeota archaeon]|nr:HEAT repeat domain-containing protein [Candidatus Woesearchaeota archaeon]